METIIAKCFQGFVQGFIVGSGWTLFRGVDERVYSGRQLYLKEETASPASPYAEAPPGAAAETSPRRAQPVLYRHKPVPGSASVAATMAGTASTAPPTVVGALAGVGGSAGSAGDAPPGKPVTAPRDYWRLVLRMARAEGTRTGMLAVSFVGASGLASLLQHGRSSDRFYQLRGEPLSGFAGCFAIAYVGLAPESGILARAQFAPPPPPPLAPGAPAPPPSWDVRLEKWLIEKGLIEAEGAAAGAPSSTTSPSAAKAAASAKGVPSSPSLAAVLGRRLLPIDWARVPKAVAAGVVGAYLCGRMGGRGGDDARE